MSQAELSWDLVLVGSYPGYEKQLNITQTYR